MRSLRSPAHSERGVVTAAKKGATMKIHEARRRLKELGFEVERQTGSHEIWKRGDEQFILPIHKGKEVKKWAERALKKG